MVIVLQLPLCLYELQGSVVCVDDCFLPHNVMLPLLDRPAQWNTSLCHRWDTFRLCLKVSHCDMPLDAPTE
jgi:hypothetical protein